MWPEGLSTDIDDNIKYTWVFLHQVYYQVLFSSIYGWKNPDEEIV